MKRRRLTPADRRLLVRALRHPGGKLPMFRGGRRVPLTVYRKLGDMGLARTWFPDPLRRNWSIYRLTEAGRVLAAEIKEQHKGGARA